MGNNLGDLTTVAAVDYLRWYLVFGKGSLDKGPLYLPTAIFSFLNLTSLFGIIWSCRYASNCKNKYLLGWPKDIAATQNITYRWLLCDLQILKCVPMWRDIGLPYSAGSLLRSASASVLCARLMCTSRVHALTSRFRICYLSILLECSPEKHNCLDVWLVLALS